MNWQQIATLVFLTLMIAFAFWAYRESVAYQKEQQRKEASSEKTKPKKKNQKHK